ncbi:hypothetical protein FHG87_005681 [Trinorchestia longiramus]|nr:hypothetical protein FHG87_005681 [Trinorchestia longiramus]
MSNVNELQHKQHQMTRLIESARSSRQVLSSTGTFIGSPHCQDQPFLSRCAWYRPSLPIPSACRPMY